ncbi:hypothetical protein SUGI_0577240 [Cryptomeria japonica]|uniref:nuclear intron maturase 3, mitochondrial n=1 Tax=Cryptomeria japonica TaxID=3369 RepID=UPI002408CC0E|nr:nuclear intron maturase 3, mitochondrial [Cryptomeria japonica]GLJ29270.1 hypothetical protein SUGI_0577240 [Cryptomeria japonica]
MVTLGCCIIYRLGKPISSKQDKSLLHFIAFRTPAIRAQMDSQMYFQFRRSNTTMILPAKDFVLKTLSQDKFQKLVKSRHTYPKWRNLVEKVLARPEVLLTAYEKLSVNSSTKVDDIVARAANDGIDCLWLKNTSRQLKEGSFDVKGCCVEVMPLRRKGEPLVLPNLKLKVVMEAVRMALEAVYEPRFVNFAYGGRVGMGRHTALRYIKNYVANPTWWFTVAFEKEKFNSERVRILASILVKKIEDKLLVDLICSFFQANVLNIEFGGLSLGRGFPQENSLCSIVINIYLDFFDREIENVRRKVDEENLARRHGSKPGDPTSPELLRECVLNDIQMTESMSSLRIWVQKKRVQQNPEGLPVFFYKPIKVYACRYLDEILIASSGSKELTLELKNKVVEFLEGNLKLRVNQSKTAIHNAIEEKIEFLGMELQAVSHSKLFPPMSDKAIRAWKKLIIRRQARAQEKRNAQETIRKRTGMKILSRVLRKLRDGDLRDPQIPIVPHINRNFKVWAQEVVKSFLQSTEDRWSWHRQFTSGRFLTIEAVRDQLPQELLDAYDQFQEKLDKYLNVDIRSSIIETDRRTQPEDKNNAQQTIKDLTKLCIKIHAPIELVRQALRLGGLINSMGRPQPIKLLIPLEDEEIILWYAGLGTRWLNYFCCCHNFKMVKKIVNYHLRFSCILTLAEKHETTKHEAIRHYTKDLKLADMNGLEEIHFPLENKIKMMGDQNLADPKPVDGLLCLTFIRMLSDGVYSRCWAQCCNKTDIVLYRIRLLQIRQNINPCDEKKWVFGLGAIHEALDRKCLPLCAEHSKYLLSGQLTLQDIDYSFISTSYNLALM